LWISFFSSLWFSVLYYVMGFVCLRPVSSVHNFANVPFGFLQRLIKIQD
jgi:hypothetical protein